jgi:aminoglycoside phosphotransferase (APT) family kinase protein
VMDRVPVSLGHGDFTPWNMFVGERRLHVYDWELAGEAPLLSDLFHFVCQTGVLVRREAPGRILRRLERELTRPAIAALVQHYGIDIDLHLRLYLLDRATYYLARYSTRTDLHVQADWLLEFWAQALQVSRVGCAGKLEHS